MAKKPAKSKSNKITYFFSKDGADGDASMKNLLGGKGANLAEMASLGCPVPPGFTIPTTYTKIYADKGEEMFAEIMPEVEEGLKRMTALIGYTPLLSCRSGAPVSMPGMMDTILNIGLNDTNLPEWKERIGERCALDSYRRLIQMMGATAFHIDSDLFEALLTGIREDFGVREDKDIPVDGLVKLVASYKMLFKGKIGIEFPQNLLDQVKCGISAVFGSWANERAQTYRRVHNIPVTMGTAVTIQAMVFGNMNNKSGSGVLFTRDPSTGEDAIIGEFLPIAQGEDVVAGIRTPMSLTKMKNLWPAVTTELVSVVTMLEEHYHDMQDIEFTVQDGTLYILQCRTGKRSAIAAFRIALDLRKAGVIDTPSLLSRITTEQYRTLSRPALASGHGKTPIGKGLAACAGVASGTVVFSSHDAILAAKEGRKVILVTKETNPDDIDGMVASVGILTSTGGVTSHAAVVARSMDKVCITGCEELKVHEKSAEIGGVTLDASMDITIDGSTGEIYLGMLPVVEAGNIPEITEVFKLIQEQEGYYLSNDRLDGDKQVVYACEWGAVEDVDAFAKALPEHPGTVLDVRPPTKFLGEVDACLWEVVDPEWEKSFLEPHLFRMSHLATYNLSGLIIRGTVGSSTVSALLIGAGAVTVTTEAPATVADYLSGMFSPPTDTWIDEVLGGKSVLDILAPLVKKVDKPKDVKDMLISEALFAYLADT